MQQGPGGVQRGVGGVWWGREEWMIMGPGIACIVHEGLGSLPVGSSSSSDSPGIAGNEVGGV
jgi:hypothetical protein